MSQSSTSLTTGSGKTPLGVDILVILEILAGIFFVIVGLLTVFRGGGGYEVMHYGRTYTAYQSGGRPIIGMLIVLLGLIHLFLASGLWSAKHWAYVWVIIVSILYLIFGVVMFVNLGYANYISLVLNVIVLVYFLASSKVKAYFA